MVNSELQKVTVWIQANRLSLNLQKTNYMIFSNSITSLPGDVQFNGVQLKQVSSTKFLGIYIDSKLNWKIHIDYLCKLLARVTGVLYKLNNIFPKDVLVTLYSSLFLPYLIYGILAWGSANKTQLERVLLIQKRAVRNVNNAPFRAHTDVLFYNNKFLKIQDIYHLHLGVIMYELSRHTLPSAISTIFVRNSGVHSYKTRQASHLHLTFSRTQFMLRSLVCTGPRFWNSLNQNITSAQNLHNFKNILKQSLLEKYVETS